MTALSGAHSIPRIPVPGFHRPERSRSRIDQLLAIRSIREEPKAGALLNLCDRCELGPMVVDVPERARAAAVDPGGGRHRLALTVERVGLLKNEGECVDPRWALVHEDLEERVGDLDGQLSRVAPMTCLQVREKESDPWQLHYFGIAGFEPQPGIEYRLRIIEEKVKNPPADASSIRWTLDQVVEQRVVGR